MNEQAYSAPEPVSNVLRILSLLGSLGGLHARYSTVRHLYVIVTKGFPSDSTPPEISEDDETMPNAVRQRRLPLIASIPPVGGSDMRSNPYPQPSYAGILQLWLCHCSGWYSVVALKAFRQVLLIHR